MKVLILAAGYGTRLAELGENRPKPLLDINGQPLIYYILEKIKDIDLLNEVIVVTNDKFYTTFTEWAQEQKDFVVPINIVNDGTKSPEERLGSIGDINFVLQQDIVNDDLLVVGGDNLFDYNVDEYIAFSREKKPGITIGLYDLGGLEDADKYGVVELDSEGQLTSFEEKPANPKSSLIAMCFYHFPKETLAQIQTYIEETQKTDKAGDYIQWLHNKKLVYGFKFTGTWYDIGSIESYKEAQEAFRA